MMVYDTLIIGGGIAGLQAAIQLGRSLRSVLVMDKGKGRSLAARKYRNILGYPDGISGKQIRQEGERQARALGVHFQKGEVIDLKQREDGNFQAEIQGQGAITAKTVLLASGIDDPFPDIPGMAPCLGESLFICPDCDGYEVLEQPAVILGTGAAAWEMALALTHFTKKLTIIDTGESKESVWEEADQKLDGVRILFDSVEEIQHEEGRMHKIRLGSGQELSADKGFLAYSGAKINTALLQPFNVERLSNGHILVNPRTKETSFPNIWAVGDIVAHSQQVTIAMGDGSQAAIWIHKRLRERTGF